MSDWVPTMTKSKQDNNGIDRIGLVYAEIETELLEPIWSNVVYEENHTEQWHDGSYKYGIHQKWNGLVLTYQPGVVCDKN